MRAWMWWPGQPPAVSYWRSRWPNSLFALYLCRKGRERKTRFQARIRDESRRTGSLVDDVLTTGKSVKEVLEAVAEKNGCVVGSGAGGPLRARFKLGYPLFSCLRSVTPAYGPKTAPCAIRYAAGKAGQQL